MEQRYLLANLYFLKNMKKKYSLNKYDRSEYIETHADTILLPRQHNILYSVVKRKVIKRIILRESDVM